MSTEPNKIIFSMVRVSKFYDKRPVIKDISLGYYYGAKIGVLGLNGSGKSSLAFDTLYAEGQRRYVESLSAYARQFLGQMEKPDVDQIEGLSPSISIDQKSVSNNPRSTVGTVTEIYDYIRILMARLGTMHCPDCHCEVGTQTSDQIVDKVMSMPIFIDPGGALFAQVAHEKLPRIYVLDAEGKVLWFDMEYSEITREEMLQTIQVALGEI